MVRRRNSRSDQLQIGEDDISINEEKIYLKEYEREEKRWAYLWLLSLVILVIALAIVVPFSFEKQELFKHRFTSLTDMILDLSLHELLPDGKYADDLMKNIMTNLKPSWSPEYGDKNSPGMILKSMGAKAHFPVLLIPGIISTGLELWEGKECARPYFRDRFWGTLTMLKALITDGKCWLEHMKLDDQTGLDPDGIRIRSAQGLEAADFLMPGFWVWARIIENLAEVGYDHNNLQMAPYDWRLTVEGLEKRDHYFSKLKSQIELLVKCNKKKVVIVSHSLGALIWHYFMKWVEADIGGNGGSAWIADHIDSVAHIGGAFLGAPKSISTIASGESRETAMLGKFETYLVEKLFSKSERVVLFRSWVGGIALLPKGGNLIWGGPDSDSVDMPSTQPFLSLPNKTVIWADDVKDFAGRHMSKSLFEQVCRCYSVGIAKTTKEAKENDKRPETWMNPLESRLPFAPKMKTYCFYGIGRTTERSYVYKPIEGQSNIEMKIDLDANSKPDNLVKGIHRCEGDGTVPLLSLGFMPIKGWRKFSHLNPSGSKTIIREYQDDTTNSKLIDVRGGPRSGDHVDILGNHDLTMDLLRIVTNSPENDAPDGLALKEIIISDIESLSSKINI